MFVKNLCLLADSVVYFKKWQFAAYKIKHKGVHSMNKSVSAQGFSLDKDQNELIEQKLKRIAYAEELIVDLALRVKEDKKYYFDATINFRWGASAHVSADYFDFAASLNKLMDVLDVKVKKEKDKIQEKK